MMPCGRFGKTPSLDYQAALELCSQTLDFDTIATPEVLVWGNLPHLIRPSV